MPTHAAARILAGAALGIAPFTPNAHANSVNSTPAEVWVLPDYDPYQSGVADWFFGNGVGRWVDGIPSIGTPSPFDPSIESLTTLEDYLQVGSQFSAQVIDDMSGNFGEATFSHQLVTPGAFDFTIASDAVPTVFDDAIAIDRVAPDFFAAMGLTGFSITGPDAFFFGLPGGPTPASVDGTSFAADLGFTGSEARDYAATVTFLTDTPGLSIPIDITGTVTDPTATVVPTPTALAAGLVLMVGLLRRRP